MSHAHPDSELVRGARAGDMQAFACLLERHMAMVRRLCRRVLSSSVGLEDVIQETALQALLGLNSLRDPRQFGPWLAGIGLNVARVSLRDRGREPWSWEALVGGRLVNEPIERGAGPHELAEALELQGLVRSAVAELPAGQRAAVVHVYLSGLTYRETAAALGVEVGAVKTRLHKGRQALQRRLRDLWTDKEDIVATSAEREMVEMRVADLRRHEFEGDKPPRSLVILEEVGGTRQLPIWIGQWEGDSIALLLEKIQVPRPLTHAFAASLLRAARVRVAEVRVHRLANETFYAQVVLDGPDGQTTVDGRPSDAIALALEMRAPINVAAQVLIAVENASPARQPEPPRSDIGAAELVDRLIERWPRDPKPTRQLSS